VLIRRIATAISLHATLFARIAWAIYRGCCVWCDETLADDVLSDVFLDVWRKLALERRSSVSTCCGHRAPQGALRTRRRTELNSTPNLRPRSQTWRNPELVLQKKNREELLRHSLARLSPEHGEVIDTHYYHGKSIKEVAEIIGINEATVKSRTSTRAELAQLSHLRCERRVVCGDWDRLLRDRSYSCRAVVRLVSRGRRFSAAARSNHPQHTSCAPLCTTFRNW